MEIPNIVFQVKEVPADTGGMVAVGEYLTLREASELLELQPKELLVTGLLSPEFEFQGFLFAAIKAPRPINLD